MSNVLSNAECVRIFLVGASGRMGYEIINIANALKNSGECDIEVVGGLVASDDPKCGENIFGVKNPIGASFNVSPDDVNVIVDFSSAKGAIVACKIAREHGLPVLIGSTGLTQHDEQVVIDTASKVPVVRARNMSVGINAMASLVSQATKLLGDSFDIEVTEIHHKMKKDAPSGTAFILAEAAAEARSASSKEEVISCGRVGDDVLRVKGEIGVQAIRGGNVAGEHTVYFIGESERIEITHRATSRAVFAQGAVRVARWLVPKKGTAGKLYNMMDVLSGA